MSHAAFLWSIIYPDEFSNNYYYSSSIINPPNHQWFSEVKLMLITSLFRGWALSFSLPQLQKRELTPNLGGTLFLDFFFCRLIFNSIKNQLKLGWGPTWEFCPESSTYSPALAQSTWEVAGTSGWPLELECWFKLVSGVLHVRAAVLVQKGDSTCVSRVEKMGLPLTLSTMLMPMCQSE